MRVKERRKRRVEISNSKISLNRLFDAVGTPNYIAPEILLCLETDPEGYSLEVDMWSAGVILYILLCGFPPFFAEDDEELYDSIIDGQFKFLKPWWDEISPEAKDLVSHLLCTDPEQRYTPEQVKKRKKRIKRGREGGKRVEREVLNVLFDLGF